MLHLEKFKEKNKDVINQMNEFIERNIANKTLKLIIASPNMFYYLREIENPESTSDDTFKYKGARVIMDDYHVASMVSYVMAENRIKFNIPCICGYFDDEEHGSRLR